MSNPQQEAACALIALQNQLTPVVRRDPVRGRRIREAMHDLSVAVLRCGANPPAPDDPLALLKVALDVAAAEGADWHDVVVAVNDHPRGPGIVLTRTGTDR